MRVVIIILVMGLMGCQGYEAGEAFYSDGSYLQREEVSAGKTRLMQTITTNMFEEDTSVIDDAAVAKILDGVIEIGEDNKIAVYKLENEFSGMRNYYGYGYLQSEEYRDLQQQYFDIIRDEVEQSAKVESVKVLPSMLTPSKLTISKLRQAAVRMQAPLLVIYSVESVIFEKTYVFRPDEVKAYSTCEMLLFDTRTGVIPFAEVVSKKHVEQKTKEDANINETRKRAERGLKGKT